MINTRFKQRNSLIPRLLAVLWIIFGFKYFLNRVNLSFSFQDNVVLLCGALCVVIGFLLYVNVYDILFVKANTSSRSFLGNIRALFESLTVNYTFTIYDIDKIQDINKVTDIPQKHSCLSYLYTITYYLFIGINNIPLLCNYIIKKRVYNLSLILFPTPMAICSFTLFLNIFTTNMSSSLIFVLNWLCYTFFALNLTYEIYVMNVFSFEHYFFIAVLVLNFVLYYGIDNFFSIFSIRNIVRKNSPKIDYSLVIEKRKNGDGGIQGFLGRIFKCDRFGVIADVFFVFNSNSSLVQEEGLREVKLDPKHIHLIYPMRNSLR
jgi:hypothetical protein